MFLKPKEPVRSIHTVLVSENKSLQNINILLYFNSQHQLSRSYIIADNVITSFTYQCFIDFNAKNALPHTSAGIVPTKASTTNFKISSFTGRKLQIVTSNGGMIILYIRDDRKLYSKVDKLT